MGIWFPQPGLHDGELVAYQAAANLFHGRRQIGSQVTVTDQRFVVVPNRLDGLTGAKRIEVSRAEITEVTVEPASSQTARKRGLSARIRPQIEIHVTDTLLVMTVSHPDQLARALAVWADGPTE